MTTDARSSRPAADEYAPYYDAYIRKVGDGDIVRTLLAQGRETATFLRAIPESRGRHRYGEGKWSIREVVGHVCDAERVFAYRALCFARGDETPLPGFDENTFIARSRLDDRPLAGLVDEFEAIRAATVALFDGLFPDEWLRRGTANGKVMSVRGLAWVIAGHELHHGEVLRARYLGSE